MINGLNTLQLVHYYNIVTVSALTMTSTMFTFFPTYKNVVSCQLLKQQSRTYVEATMNKEIKK